MNLEKKLNLIKKLYSYKKDDDYFYNPYYPISDITLDELKYKWKELYKNDPNHLTHLYIHTPFCLEKCNFCKYHGGFSIKDKGIIEKYLLYLEDYIKELFYILKGKNFGGLYFGGGTASIYSEEQLDRLLSVIFNNVSFNGEYLKEFELHPSSTTFKKLEILRKYGIDRISFGIQSFNKKTTYKEGRTYCSPKRFKELIDYSKKLGFESINADLIIGLNSENKEDMLYSLKEMFNCEPYSIDLYTIQDNKETSNLYEGENKFYSNVKNTQEYLINNLINKSNYEYYDDDGDSLRTGIFLKLSGINHPTKKSYEAHVNNIESIFGAGFGAYSHIFGIGKYIIPDNIYDINHINVDFENLNDNDEKNIFLSRFIQESIIDIDFFKSVYDMDFIKSNKNVIDFLLEKNKIIINNNEIIFTTKNIKETYIFGLLFFDLNFILRHSLYMY